LAVTYPKSNSLKKSVVFDYQHITLTKNQTKSFQLKNINPNKAVMINLEQSKIVLPNKNVT
jgi:hypothetical protein